MLTRIRPGLVMLALFAVIPCAAAQDTITITGVITGPDGAAVANVPVVAYTHDGGFAEDQTDAAGAYALTLPAGEMGMHVLPDLDSRLVQIHAYLGLQEISFTRDFVLQAGWLAAGTVSMAEGGAVVEGCRVAATSMDPSSIEGDSWLATECEAPSGSFAFVLPADIHWLGAEAPPPYYGSRRGVDLRAGDVSGIALTLGTTPVTNIPFDPPIAARIGIGQADGLGEASVTGAAGAALGLGRVLVVNLGSAHQAHTAAEADGSFELELFAPPGSTLLVKHGPASTRWLGLEQGIAEGVSPYPGTIITVPWEVASDPGARAFADAGSMGLVADDSAETANRVGAAWSVSGTIAPVDGADSLNALAPGDELHLRGSLRVYSQEITGADQAAGISAWGFPTLLALFGRDGHSLAAYDVFMSSRLTATGFPIQRPEGAWVGEMEPVIVEGFTLVGEHTAEGGFDLRWTIPADAPPATYRPVIFFHSIDGVPLANEWVAANVFSYTFSPDQAVLPPIVVTDGGPVASPRLIWRLLTDEHSQGTRGTGAREDRGRFELASQIVSQGARYCLPPADPVTGETFSYRLEPFLPTITFTDRRIPGRPTIPLAFPGGELSITITAPDGSTRELDPAPFAQSFNRTPTTRAGLDLNPGTSQLNDVYSLTTGESELMISFEDFGHHAITMRGEAEDVWGNTYSGGGTYDLWIAHPLNMKTGVLPGTPLAVNRGIDTTVRLLPPVPAEVSFTLTLVPDSDPERQRSWSVSGYANRFGVFTASRELIVPDHPGEYRVDVSASYTAPNGDMFMGSATWGGVVMTPPAEAQLVAHGRRGVDSLGYIPASWFVASRDLVIPAGSVSHAYNAYYAGDILWSRMSDGLYGGDALLIQASVQDRVGEIKSALERRLLRQMSMDSLPDDLQERFDYEELPLFSSTTSGLPPRLAAADVDQIAYSYRSSQRPGVRVREVVTEDGESGGYWRLDTTYDRQPGVGVLGDQTNDFKFQFVGTVYRDLESGHSEYGGQASGWIFIPDSDATGTRLMPPFAGPGNGGWTTEGGPILTLGGEAVHIFIHPTGVAPGAVLEVGDRFTFSGQVMPPLGSSVEATVTSPTGVEYVINGAASSVGYFAGLDDSSLIQEPGAWSVDVRVWHDGSCSGGMTVPPYPSGNVLGSDQGRYWFYVVPKRVPLLEVSTPAPGHLAIGETVLPITISGPLPAGIAGAVLHYTVAMPSYVLDSGRLTLAGDTYSLVYDPVALQASFPNLDLIGTEDMRPGLADTVTVSLLLTGTIGQDEVHRANLVALEGQLVSMPPGLTAPPPRRAGGRMP